MTAHPEYATQHFFVFGESFGGHYAPAVAHSIMTKNNEGGYPVAINLHGLALGNGLTDPVTQYQVRTLTVMPVAAVLSLLLSKGNALHLFQGVATYLASPCFLRFDFHSILKLLFSDLTRLIPPSPPRVVSLALPPSTTRRWR